MSRLQRTFKTAAVLIGVAALVAGCSGNSGGGNGGGGTAPDSADPIHFSVSVAQANDVNGLWWRVGQNEGIFEKNGIIVDEIIAAEGGGDTLQTLLAGDLPFGQIATSALVNAHLEGAPIKVIAGATQSPYEIGWAVQNDSDIETIEDLEGKTWGFTNAGSVTEAMSFLVPAHAGLDMDNVKRVATGGVGAGIALLESGDVDVTFVPPLVAEEQKGNVRVVVHADEFVPHYQLTMIAASEKYLEQNPEVAEALLKSLNEAREWIVANPDEAGELYASIVEVDPEIGKSIVQRYIEIDLWGTAFNPQTLEVAAEGLQYTDGIDSVDWSSLLVDDYLPEGAKGTIP